MARSLDLALAAIAVAYPFLVHFGLRILPSGFLAPAALALFALRLALERRGAHQSLPYLHQRLRGSA
jgi:hypothetical protein